MIWLYRKLFGELTVLFGGTSPERILNISARSGLGLRCTSINKNGISATVSVRSFRKMRKLIRKTGIRPHIIKKSGFPFFIMGYKDRSGLLIGFILFCIVLKLMSGYIWTVDIVGNKNTDDEKIIEAARKVGVFEGAKISDIKTTAAAQKMLLDMPELAWASFNIESSRVTINVTEVKKTDKESSSVPINLKAKHDGVITSIDVTAGNVLVKVGDIVSKGDILVAGVKESYGFTSFVHARGTVLAETVRVLREEGSYTVNKRVKNGECAKRSVLSVFGIDIPLYIGEIKEPYMAEQCIKNLRLFNVELPVRITTKSFYFTEKKTESYSFDELAKLLGKRLDEKADEMHLINPLVRDERIIKSEQGIAIERTVVSVEEISEEDLILFDNTN